MRTNEELAEDMERLDAEVKAFVVKLAGVEAEEARLLREVEESRVWHWLGMTSAVAYVEARFGIGYHAASERLRVARALAELPMIEAAFESGEISYGHARELTRW